MLVLGDDASKAVERPRTKVVQHHGSNAEQRVSEQASCSSTPQMRYREVSPSPLRPGSVKQVFFSTESKQQAVHQGAASKPRLAWCASHKPAEINVRRASLPLRPPVPKQQRRPSPSKKERPAASAGESQSARELIRTASAPRCTNPNTISLGRGAANAMQWVSQSKAQQQKAKPGTGSESSKKNVLQTRPRKSQTSGRNCSQFPAREQPKFAPKRKTNMFALNFERLPCRNSSQKVAEPRHQQLANSCADNAPFSAASSSSSTDAPSAQGHAAALGCTAVESADYVSEEPEPEEFWDSECLSSPRSVCSSLPLNTARSALIVGPGAAYEADTWKQERVSLD